VNKHKAPEQEHKKSGCYTKEYLGVRTQQSDDQAQIFKFNVESMRLYSWETWRRIKTASKKLQVFINGAYEQYTNPTGLTKPDTRRGPDDSQ
jgi:hypothetical protein